MAPKFDGARLLPPGVVEVGDYVVTKELPTGIRCKAYTQPPSQGDGIYLQTFPPGTRLGPVEQVEKTADFVTIRVEEFWINIRGSKYRNGRVKNTAFAFVERWGAWRGAWTDGL